MKFHNFFTFSRIKKEQKYFVAGIVVTALLTIFVVVPITFKTGVYAEQTGQTPESGAISRIKQAYDMLTALDYGSEVSSSLGNWGVMWNRLISAAEWTPDATVTNDKVVLGETFYADSRTQDTGTLALTGDATSNDVMTGKTYYGNTFTKDTGTWSFLGNASTSDVLTGKTFYGNSSTLLTGTAKAPIDFSLQQYSARDDYAGTYNGGTGPEDYQLEESTWTSPATNVWKDERTGVYWGPDRGVVTKNQFSLSECDFFTSTPRSSYTGTDIGVGNLNCGPAEDAINYCATLDFGGRTDWYLPSQKELMQAYIDGMYNQAGATLTDAATFTWGTGATAGYSFWSSSELSFLPAYAWTVYLASGGTSGYTKPGTNAVRCVARD